MIAEPAPRIRRQSERGGEVAPVRGGMGSPPLPRLALIDLALDLVQDLSQKSTLLLEQRNRPGLL